jgi:hypothetical protein
VLASALRFLAGDGLTTSLASVSFMVYIPALRVRNMGHITSRYSPFHQGTVFTLP